MLETFYNNFGFFGSILIAFTLFVVSIFWMAGVAGIAQLPASKNKTVKLVFCILIPIYPFIWLFFDMYHQWKHMKE